jgi:hypothetical protein
MYMVDRCFIAALMALGCGKVVADPILSDNPGRDGGEGAAGEWAVSFDGAKGDDLGRAAAVLENGDLMIAGNLSADDDTTRIWLARLSPSGETRWSKTFGSHDGQARGLALEPDAVTVVGSLRTPSNLPRVWLARVAPGDGALGWAVNYPTDESFKADGYGVSVDWLGQSTLAGLATNAAGNNDAWAARFDASGSSLWTRTEAGNANGHDSSYDVVTFDDGALVLAGYVTTLTQGQDASIRKLDSEGMPLWTQLRDSGENADDLAHAVTADSLGNVYAVGHETASVKAWVAKYSPAGTLVWSRQSDRTKSAGRDVAVDGDGNVVLCGYVVVDAGHRASWAWRLDSAGNTLGERVSNTSGDSECYGVASLGGRAILVTGYGPSVDSNADAVIERWEL